MACRNPQLAALRAHKREDLLAATERSLQAIKARVDAGRLAGADAIGLRVGKVVNQYKVAKHFASIQWGGLFAFNALHSSTTIREGCKLGGPL